MSLLNFLPLIIIIAGLYFLIKLKFFFIRHPIKVIKKLFITLREKSSRRALALALAGTLGVGNIVGVAYGIMKTGGGCILWILISSIFSGVIKYSESLISADEREEGCGGMMYVVKNTFSHLGKPLALLYAALCLMLSLTMGAMLQAKSVISFANEAVNIKPIFFAIFFAFFVFISIVNGSERIEKITSVVIPMATIVYIFLCFSVIFKNISNLSETIFKIISSSLNLSSVGAGAFLFLSSSALREGFARGLLSNEAGAGTSAMAESRSRSSDASAVGLLGACEVFFDTTLLCTLTGITILITGIDVKSYSNAAALIIGSFENSLGSVSGIALFILIAAFAYSTVICWYYYGFECVRFLFGKASYRVYLFFFITSVCFGFVFGEGSVIKVTDYILFFMTVITLLTLIKKSERIALLSENIKEL